MTTHDEFVDYYRVLQIDPASSAKALEAAYRHWAKVYHPDHPDSADVEKFTAVIEAYRVLRDPEQRSAYDPIHHAHVPRDPFAGIEDNEFGHEVAAALDDAEAHDRILRYLYRRRRENALDPGVPGYVLQDLLNCTDEQFEFHRWYLKEKGYLAISEQGTLAITIAGIDHVISAARSQHSETLRIGQSGGVDAPESI